MSTTKKKIKVLVADDHPVVRKGIITCLANKENLKVVGEAVDGPDTIQKTLELQPDVILLDLEMPQLDGLAVTERLRKEAPQVKVLILSTHSQRDYVLRIIRVGARGYVLKDTPPDELVKAIAAVNEGEAFFSPPVARIALNQYVDESDSESPLARLSDREKQVLALIAEGKSNKEIAVALNIGVRTTETHRERIMRKLDIHSVAGLTKFAIANGIVSLEGGGLKT